MLCRHGECAQHVTCVNTLLRSSPLHLSQGMATAATALWNCWRSIRHTSMSAAALAASVQDAGIAPLHPLGVITHC